MQQYLATYTGETETEKKHNWFHQDDVKYETDLNLKLKIKISKKTAYVKFIEWPR